jgi:hypothetical protein
MDACTTSTEPRTDHGPDSLSGDYRARAVDVLSTSGALLGRLIPRSADRLAGRFIQTSDENQLIARARDRDVFNVLFLD